MSLFAKNRVLVPIDFSDASFVALEETLAFVEHPNHVYVLHVLPPLSAMEPGIIWKTISDRTRIESVKKVFQDRYQGKDEGINFEVLIGDPGTEIIDYANKQQIELIVIPSHGRTGLNRFLMGSVAERVVRCSHCPVLVLRRKDKS